MSLQIAKLFNRRAALASAALVIHIGSAMAADSRGDIQQQIKEWLVGTPVAHSSSPSAIRDGHATNPSLGAQEQAKRLLVGASARVGGAEPIKRPEFTGASAKTESDRRPAAYGDVQAAAGQLLLSQPVASPARRPATRTTR